MEALLFYYRDRHGQLKERKVVPKRVYYGATAYYPAPQWLLEAFDVESGELKVFAMANINRTM
jgi:predicted DNA-binding transcriptional regulator YafY